MTSNSLVSYLWKIKHSLSILSITIQSVNAKFSVHEAFLEELNTVNITICLQETCINDTEDMSPFQHVPAKEG